MGGSPGTHLIGDHRKAAPCSPARAASMAALRANGLVCSATPRMTSSTGQSAGVSCSEAAHRLHRLHHLVRQLADGLPGLDHHLAAMLGQIERRVAASAAWAACWPTSPRLLTVICSMALATCRVSCSPAGDDGAGTLHHPASWWACTWFDPLSAGCGPPAAPSGWRRG